MKRILLSGTHSRWEGDEKKFVRYIKGKEIEVTSAEARSPSLKGRLGPVPTPEELAEKAALEAAEKDEAPRGRRRGAAG